MKKARTTCNSGSLAMLVSMGWVCACAPRPDTPPPARPQGASAAPEPGPTAKHEATPLPEPAAPPGAEGCEPARSADPATSAPRSERFRVLVARFADDPVNRTQNLVVHKLGALGVPVDGYVESGSQARGYVVAKDDVLIDVPHPSEAEAGYARAREILRVRGADALVWGEVLYNAGEQQFVAYVTSAAASRGGSRTRFRGYRLGGRPDARVPRARAPGPDRSAPTPPVALSSIALGAHVGDLLQATVVTRAAASGHALRPREALEAEFPRLQRLVFAEDPSASDGKLPPWTPHFDTWSSEARREVLFVYILLLLTDADLTGSELSLRLAEGLARRALDDAPLTPQQISPHETIEPAPRQHARFLNLLGVALQGLGERARDSRKLEEAIEVYHQALELLPKHRHPDEGDDRAAHIRNSLGTAYWTVAVRGDGFEHFRKAIESFQQALAGDLFERKPLVWAQLQNNLGVAQLHLGERQGDISTLQAAVHAHEAVLRVHTRKDAPMEWAMSQLNLGLALLAIAESTGEDATLGPAIAALRQALCELTREGAPLLWAAAQHDLGVALWTSVRLSGGVLPLHEAIEAYESALQVYSQQRTPRDWAITQEMLGEALRELAVRSGAGREVLERALKAHEAALSVWKRDQERWDWARAQRGRANALQSLGAHERDAKSLRAALAGYDRALEILSRDRAPMEWARVHHNRGAALKVLGELEKSPELLRRSVAARRRSLEVWTKAKAPHYWAAAQDALGSTLTRLARFGGGDRSLMDDAVSAHQQALSVWTRERAPSHWAGVQQHLAIAWSAMGDRESRLRGVEAYEAALLEVPQALDPRGWSELQHNLGTTLSLLGETERALVALDRALEVRSEPGLRAARASTQHVRGGVLMRLGIQGSGTARLEQAVAAYRDSLAHIERESSPRLWGLNQLLLAEAARRISERRREPPCEAIAAGLEALTTLKELDHPHAELARKSLRQDMAGAKAPSPETCPRVPLAAWRELQPASEGE
ncbi:MAG: tetratricopeptide repeat protein [Myxococcales bacterium]|nr:tetratricopeptide repeat protein [Myxococcales bacterium]